MKSFFAVAAAAASVSALTIEESHVGRFNNWKLEHGKAYKSIEEEEARFEVFMSNHAAIEAHNADATNTYTQGHNKFSDMTEDEFKSVMTGLVFPVGHKSTADAVHKVTDSVPSAIDWREKGAVTAVKNQGQCGSCWAFSTTGAVEGQNLIKNGGAADDNANILSEQQLVDCSTKNYGCNGGNVDLAFEYLKGVSKGDDTEQSYPYEGQDNSCHADEGTPSHVKVVGYTDITGGEDGLKHAVGTVGPVSIAVDAGPFQFYKSGILSKDCGRQLDHGVLMVGYGSTSSQDDYWIIKNSWSESWGEDGYIRVAMGSNLCGVADRASYPTIA